MAINEIRGSKEQIYKNFPNCIKLKMRLRLSIVAPASWAGLRLHGMVSLWEKKLPQKIAKLVDLPFGSSGFVAKIKLEPLESKRLEDLGLRHGAPIKILEGGKDDSILIGVGDARVGVNYQVATHIYVYLEK